jgi:hypothetical protein
MITNRPNGVSNAEKEFLFKYCKSNPKDVCNGESVERFSKNLVIIVNSFFEYGFKAQSFLNTKRFAHHYWELITEAFNTLSSVSYINEKLSSSKNEEKGLMWMLLIFNEEGLLPYIF